MSDVNLLTGLALRLGQFTKRTIFSKSRHNDVVDAVNALYRIEIKRGGSSDAVFYSDNNVIIQLTKAEGGTAGGMRYRGEYTNVPDENYIIGDVVRVTPESVFSTTYADPGPTVPGVYVCIKDNPGETDYPIHSLQTGGETAFWELLATQPTEMQVCDPATGDAVEYFIDAQPKPA